jgi:hypothetical protein
VHSCRWPNMQQDEVLTTHSPVCSRVPHSTLFSMQQGERMAAQQYSPMMNDVYSSCMPAHLLL